MNDQEDVRLHLNPSHFLGPHGRGHGLAGPGVAARIRGCSPPPKATTRATDQKWRGVVNPLHFKPRCKRMIYLYMAGGPSHLETFDYKPKLAEMHGQPMPESFTKGQPIAQLQGQQLKCFAPQHPFAKYGKSQQEICTIFPNIGKLADDMCIIRSMHTDAINHDPAHTFMNTGTTISGRPSMGSWLLYGLGSDADDLPGFVVMTSSGKFGQQPADRRPHVEQRLSAEPFQGVAIPLAGRRGALSQQPAGVSDRQQHDVIQAAEALNRIHDDVGRRSGNPDPHRAIRNGVQDADQRAGPDGHVAASRPTCWKCTARKGADGSFAANCLLARRLAERGVRFIQLYHRDWDHHGGLKQNMQGIAGEVDQADLRP